MVYDRADWHYGGDFPKDLPPENGGTHIGMFLAWAIHRGLESELHREESNAAVAAVRARLRTGRDFLFSECDEKFTDQDLSDEGNAFAQAYYELGDGGYLSDYAATFADDEGDTLYHVADTWPNFDRIAAALDRRYAAWKGAQTHRS